MKDLWYEKPFVMELFPLSSHWELRTEDSVFSFSGLDVSVADIKFIFYVKNVLSLLHIIYLFPELFWTQWAVSHSKSLLSMEVWESMLLLFLNGKGIPSGI
jgi:hypothetical protein